MSAARCPHCRRLVFLSPVPDKTLSDSRTPWRQTDIFAATTGQTNTDVLSGDWYKTTPVGRLEPRDIVTQLLDAAVSFGFAAIAGTAAAWYWDWPLVIGPAVGFVAAAFRYFNGMRLATNLLEIVEEMVNKPKPDKPEPDKNDKPQKTVVRAEVNEGQRWTFAEFDDIDPAAIRRFADGLLSGRYTFSETGATATGMRQGQFSGTGANDPDSFRGKFIANGWARWRKPGYPKQGATLTAKGRAIARALASPPLPR